MSVVTIDREKLREELKANEARRKVILRTLKFADEFDPPAAPAAVVESPHMLDDATATAGHEADDAPRAGRKSKAG